MCIHYSSVFHVKFKHSYTVPMLSDYRVLFHETFCRLSLKFLDFDFQGNPYWHYLLELRRLSDDSDIRLWKFNINLIFKGGRLYWWPSAFHPSSLPNSSLPIKGPRPEDNTFDIWNIKISYDSETRYG